jgi:hypothetical protein
MDRDELDMMDLADAARPWVPLVYKIDRAPVLFPSARKKFLRGFAPLSSRYFRRPATVTA